MLLSYRSATIDVVVVRNAILHALRDSLPRFKGRVVDVGCGNQPYRDLICSGDAVESYIGVDMANDLYAQPEVVWDGVSLPLDDASADTVMMTEVLEHCPDPQSMMSEAARILRDGGVLFLTTPFFWPLHDLPHDEYRYTPISLERHARAAGLSEIDVRPLGGWDATLAQCLGLWVRRRHMAAPLRRMLSLLLCPLIRALHRHDRVRDGVRVNLMTPGWSMTASKYDD